MSVADYNFEQELNHFHGMKKAAEMALSHKGITTDAPLMKWFCKNWDIPINEVHPRKCSVCEKCPDCNNTGNFQGKTMGEYLVACTCWYGQKIAGIKAREFNAL